MNGASTKDRLERKLVETAHAMSMNANADFAVRGRFLKTVGVAALNWFDDEMAERDTDHAALIDAVRVCMASMLYFMVAQMVPAKALAEGSAMDEFSSMFCAMLRQTLDEMTNGARQKPGQRKEAVGQSNDYRGGVGS
jgi:hypothetical protein